MNKVVPFHKIYNHQKKTTNVSFLMGGKRLHNSPLDTHDRYAFFHYFSWLLCRNHLAHFHAAIRQRKDPLPGRK